jgi:predicted YcjX-like family ATPase
MRVITLDKNAAVESQVEAYLGSTVSESSPMTHKSYHEMADKPVVEVDCLAQLHTNIEMLSDLQSRLSFLMREVRYLMKV